MVKHAFVWWCLTHQGLSDAHILDAGQTAGFEGVEMVPEHLWGEVKQRGLTMVSTQAHGSIESGMNDPSQHNRIIAETCVMLEKAEVEHPESDLLQRQPRYPHGPRGHQTDLGSAFQTRITGRASQGDAGIGAIE